MLLRGRQLAPRGSRGRVKVLLLQPRLLRKIVPKKRRSMECAPLKFMLKALDPVANLLFVLFRQPVSVLVSSRTLLQFLKTDAVRQNEEESDINRNNF